MLIDILTTHRQVPAARTTRCPDPCGLVARSIRDRSAALHASVLILSVADTASHAFCMIPKVTRASLRSGSGGGRRERPGCDNGEDGKSRSLPCSLEAAHAADHALNAVIVLPEPVVQGGVGATPGRHAAERPRIEAMATASRPNPTHIPRSPLAERKNVLAAFMSRCSLSMASIRLPPRSIACRSRPSDRGP